MLSTCGMKLPLLIASYVVYKSFSSEKPAKIGALLNPSNPLVTGLMTTQHLDTDIRSVSNVSNITTSFGKSYTVKISEFAAIER